MALSRATASVECLLLLFHQFAIFHLPEGGWEESAKEQIHVVLVLCLAEGQGLGGLIVHHDWGSSDLILWVFSPQTTTSIGWWQAKLMAS